MRIQKAKWIAAYYQAHHQVFSAKNIKASFSSTGIYPFNPDKVLDRIRSMPVLAPVTTRAPTAASPTTPELPVTSTSTSTTETTSFPTQVLTSSPSDFSVLQAANSVLNRMVDTAEPLSTPARKYIRSLTSTSERLFARTSILQEHTEAQETLLTKRKQREEVKCSLIKGKYLLSTPEIHAEKVAV